MPLLLQRRLEKSPTETFGQTRAETTRLVGLCGYKRDSQLWEFRELEGLLGDAAGDDDYFSNNRKLLAEREGFEPSRHLLGTYTISSRTP